MPLRLLPFLWALSILIQGWCFGNDLPPTGEGGGTTPPPGHATDGGYVQLTDGQFSVIAHVSQGTGRVVHRYGYSVNGQLRSMSMADVNGDGVWGNASDDAALSDAVNATPPDPRGDFNGDGATDTLDLSDYADTRDDVLPPCGR